MTSQDVGLELWQDLEFAVFEGVDAQHPGGGSVADHCKRADHQGGGSCPDLLAVRNIGTKIDTGQYPSHVAVRNELLEAVSCQAARPHLRPGERGGRELRWQHHAATVPVSYTHLR